MSEQNLPNEIKPRIHPMVAQLQTFLEDVLTEAEYHSRINVVLSMIDPYVIIEAGKQLEANILASTSE